MNRSQIKSMQRDIQLRPLRSALKGSPIKIAQSIGGGILFTLSFLAIFTLAGIFN